MSTQLTPVNLAAAVVGTSGSIGLAANTPPPTIAQQMRPSQMQGSTLFLYNESGCGLTCSFPQTHETFTLAAGAWKQVAVPPNEVQLNYTVNYLLSNAAVNTLFADLYLPGETPDSIGILGNSPIGGIVTTSTATQVVNNGNPGGTFVLDASAAAGLGSSHIENNGVGHMQVPSRSTTVVVWSSTAGGAPSTPAVIQFGDKNNQDVITLYGGLGSAGFPVASVAGQATATNSMGVPAIVGAARAVGVNAVGSVTIVSFTPSVDGTFEVGGYARVNNGTNGNAINFVVGYTDPYSGTAVSLNPPAVSTTGAGPTLMNGVNNIVNAGWSLTNTTIEAKAGVAIVINYNDPTNTPNDHVAAWIRRIA